MHVGGLAVHERIAPRLATCAILVCMHVTLALAACVSVKTNRESLSPAVTASVDDIEFVCWQTHVIEEQFPAKIVGGPDGQFECLQTPSGTKPAIWFVAPISAKVRRHVIYKPSNSEIQVLSRPVTLVKILALDRNTQSCVHKTIEIQGRQSSFSLAPPQHTWPPEAATVEQEHTSVLLSDIFDEARRTIVEIGGAFPRATHDVAWSVTRCDEDWDDAVRRSLTTKAVANGHRESLVKSDIPEMRSVVRIERCEHGESGGARCKTLGTGFFVEEDEQGGDAELSTLVVTNYHVVRELVNQAIRLSTLSFDAIARAYNSVDHFKGLVVFFDERRDLAAVRVSKTHGHAPLLLCDDEPDRNEIRHIALLGHPADLHYYMTVGVVTREIADCTELFDRPPESDHLDNTLLKCVQHDAASFGGASGGPLLSVAENQPRCVLGVNKGGREGKIPVMPYEDADGESDSKTPQRWVRLTIPGQGYAIDHEEVRAFLDEYHGFGVSR